MSEPEKAEAKIEEKAKKLEDLLKRVAKEPGAEDDMAVIAELIDDNGNPIADMSMPREYEIEVMAIMMLDHLVSYKQSDRARIGARAAGNGTKAGECWQQMRYNQMTIALIQRDYPETKPIAAQLAKDRAKTIQQQRKASEQQQRKSEDES